MIDDELRNDAALTIHRNLPAMVASYEEAKREMTAGFAAIERARDIFNGAFALGGHGDNYHQAELRIPTSRYSSRDHIEPGSCAHALNRLRRSTWDVIVERIEYKRFASSERWKKLQDAIENDELPEPSMASINGFLNQQIHDLPTILEESVKEVFEFLRPRGERYKRNSEEEIPRKVILSYMLQGRRRVSYGWGTVNPSGRLLAMENVFHALDGRGQISKAHKSEVEQAIEAGESETDLFAFSCYANNNLHLTFKRLDLLKRLNEIAGGKRLRKTKVGGSNLAVAAE